jgi:hypothetical protein
MQCRHPRLSVDEAGLQVIEGRGYRRILDGAAVVAALAVIGAVITVLVNPYRQPRAPDCRPPANESKVLDAYEADPVFAVQPRGARRVRGPERTEACIQLSLEDVSATSVEAEYRPAHDYTTADLETSYRGVAVASGWTPSTDQAQPTGPKPDEVLAEAQLRFCKRILGVTSYLDIYAQSSAQAAPGGHRVLLVSITAWATEPTCLSS